MLSRKELSRLMERLHTIHRQLNDLSSRLKKGPATIQIMIRKKEELEKKLEQVESKYRELQLQAKEKEGELARKEEALTKRRDQLSEAKTNKEYQALQLQISIDAENNGKLADTALEAIEAAESFEPQVKTAQENLKKHLEEIQKFQNHFEEKKPVILADLERCKKELEENEQLLPEDFIYPYRNLVKKKGGEDALAIVHQQCYCSGCYHQIALPTLSAICLCKLTLCHSCGRILYVPEDYVLK